ncbi:MAG: hypothetical protein HY816_00635 [Candidatus Wallbacteria bacterium]|nr:hypothetical protein [Candidatus Wallbacteria bacterium]
MHARSIGFGLAAWLLLAGACLAATDDSGRTDPQVLDEPVAEVDSELEEDSAAVASSLAEYVREYSAPAIAKLEIRWELEVQTPHAVVPSRDRQSVRRLAKRAELTAIVDRAAASEVVRAFDAQLATLLFQPLRAIYPNAHLMVVVHDGVRTLSRAEWDPQDQEPSIRAEAVGEE